MTNAAQLSDKLIYGNLDKLIIQLLNAVDYDIAKQYQLETAEEPEFVEENLQELRNIIINYFRKESK